MTLTPSLPFNWSSVRTMTSSQNHGFTITYPKWILSEGEEPSPEPFKSFSEADTLTFIIGQKHTMFKSLNVLGESGEYPDLYTIESRISMLENYGPKEIMEDIEALPYVLREIHEKNGKKSNPRTLRRQIKSAYQLIRIVKEELENYATCPDCVAHYYSSFEYFVIPCRKLHNVILFKSGETWSPAKTLRVDEEQKKVEVAFFGTAHSKMWLPFNKCHMVTVCFTHKPHEEMTELEIQSLLEMNKYIHMIASKHQRYFKFYPCSKVTLFTPDKLLIPDDLLATEMPEKCETCDAGFYENVKIASKAIGKKPEKRKIPAKKGKAKVSRSSRSSSRSEARRPCTVKTAFEEIQLTIPTNAQCSNQGCGKKGIQECLLCDDAFYCSDLCSHFDFYWHIKNCKKNKLVNEPNIEPEPEAQWQTHIDLQTSRRNSSTEILEESDNEGN